MNKFAAPMIDHLPQLVVSCFVSLIRGIRVIRGSLLRYE